VTKDTNAVVLHLGTNNALNAKSDGHCLLDALNALDDMETTLQHRQCEVPVFLCAVPPVAQRDSQRRADMLNALYQHRCNQNKQLHFIETNLKPSDLGRDGIHLTSSGKGKLAEVISSAVLGFTRGAHQHVT
jgi:hypothetical protein